MGSLLVLAPAWSYSVSGTADHWWFVARSASRMYYYVSQFFAEKDDRGCAVTGEAYLGMWAAVLSGLQYPQLRWWYAREWKDCVQPRTKVDLDKLIQLNPSGSKPYSWVDNNCQHFAEILYDGEEPYAA